jgi:hypothetical protein
MYRTLGTYRLASVLLIGALGAGGCVVDVPSEPEDESTGSGATSDAPDTSAPATSDPPTTSDPTTSGDPDLSTSTGEATTASTGDPDTSGSSSTSGDSDETGNDTDTAATTEGDDTTEGVDSTADDTSTGSTGDSDDTTGEPDPPHGGVSGKSMSETVNGGTVAVSPNFRMVFTLGQPAQHQGSFTSQNFKLQGGLAGAIGEP